WSAHVEVGIDATATTVTTTPVGTGGGCVRMTFTPTDKYGNMLGPGKGDAFTLVAQPGSTISGPLRDVGNGSYQVDVCADTSGGTLTAPSVGLQQPGRPPVVVRPKTFQIYA